MPLFSRTLRPGSEDGAHASGSDAEAQSGGPRHTIGELLRQTRQGYGGEIDRIAATLRIRASYLTAIEQSDYDKLPGPVYAQGFVRAYAVHLGLDGDEAVRRFKQEIAGFEVSRDLSFPVPLAERSIPGGTMVLAALILAICGYGLWYYVSTGDRSHPERVGAVPSDLISAAQAPGGGPPAPAVPPSPTVTPSPPAQPSQTAAATPTPSPVPPTPAPAPISASNAAPPAAAPETPATTAASVPPSPAAATSPPSAAASAPAPTASTAPPPAAAIVAAAPPPSIDAPTTAASPQASAPPAQAASLSPETAAASPPPRVYGVPTNVPARIVIHAIKDSWIQLRSGDQVLVQRLLHPGDSVRVPDEQGLLLRTGNGAGLQFEVDGKLGKPLSGTVRTVTLDADRLPGGNVPRNLTTRNEGPPRDE